MDTITEFKQPKQLTKENFEKRRIEFVSHLKESYCHFQK